MSDVTTEEVKAERERAHALSASEDLCDWWDGGEEDHSTPCTRIATALAVRAREARREALKEAADGEQRVADSLCGWMEQQPVHSEKRKELSLRAGERGLSAVAIRALLGPGT